MIDKHTRALNLILKLSDVDCDIVKYITKTPMFKEEFPNSSDRIIAAVSFLNWIKSCKEQHGNHKLQ